MRVGLDGRVIIVTGAASGIGAAIAAEAAASGAALLLTDRDGPAAARAPRTSAALGAEVATVAADLLDPDAPDVIAGQALDALRADRRAGERRRDHRPGPPRRRHARGLGERSSRSMRGRRSS